MKYSMKKIILTLSISLLLTACGSDSDSEIVPDNSDTGIINQGDAERIAVSFANAFIGMQEAQTYPMILIIGDLVSSNPQDGNTQTCLDSGSYTKDFVDLDNSGNISSGESSDVTFNTCFGASSAPVNGSIHQELINFDADFGDELIIATDIRRWNAEYIFTNFSRTDTSTRERTQLEGEFSFDYQEKNNGVGGWTMDTLSTDLLFTNFAGSVFMRDLGILYDYSESIDRLSATFTGSIIDTIGSITVESGSLRIDNFSTNSQIVSGTLELRSQFSTLRISFSDIFSFDLLLDSDNDGIFESSWQYSPIPTSTPNELEGIWDVFESGVQSPNDEVFEFSGSNVTYSDFIGEFFSGTFTDSSTASLLRMQITVVSSTQPSAVGETGNCIYEYDNTGLELILACNDPGVEAYPEDFEPAMGVTIWELVKQ